MEWLKRALWGSRRRKVAAVVLASLLALVAAAGIADAVRGGSSPQPAGPTLEPASPDQPASQEAVCTTGPASHNMRATFYGTSPDACTLLNQEVAERSGEFWRVAPTGSYVEGSDLVCSMAKGSELIEVRDTGEHDYGNRFCASMTAKGWTEQEGPGERAEKARKAQEGQEKTEGEQREAEQHARQQRSEDTEHKKEEAVQKAENEHQEAENKKQLEEDERRNHEDTRKAEEEAHRAEQEANAH